MWSMKICECERIQQQLPLAGLAVSPKVPPKKGPAGEMVSSAEGHGKRCKKCGEMQALECRRTKRPILKPCSQRVTAGSNYIERNCELCGKTYNPMKHNQRFCFNCTLYWRNISSRLTQSRNRFERRRQVTRDVKDRVVQKHYHATHCEYCGRVFDDTVKKSIDHEPPICMGTDPADDSKMVICCLECNRSKARLCYSDWIALNKMVLANYEKKNVLVSGIGQAPAQRN